MKRIIAEVVIVCSLFAPFTARAADEATESKDLTIESKTGYFYVNKNQTACLPTEKLVLIMGNEKKCQGDVLKLKLDVEQVQKERIVDLKACGDKCKEGVDQLAALCKNCETGPLTYILWGASLAATLALGFVAGYYVGGFGK